MASKPTRIAAKSFLYLKEIKMRRFVLSACVLSALISGHVVSAAQPEGPPPGRQNGEGGPGGRGPGGPGGGRGFAPPFMAALDTDGDGEISAEEISKASEALKTLDKNGDGKLNREELLGNRGGRGPGGPGMGGRDGGPGGPGGGPSMSERMLQMDKDGDGKISKDEAPERMKENFDRWDTNKDGFIDKEEIQKMMSSFGGGRPRGDNPPGGNPPGDAKPTRPVGENDL
jgi:collagen type III alpha